MDSARIHVLIAREHAFGFPVADFVRARQHDGITYLEVVIARKRFCLVPYGFDVRDLQRHRCDDRSHAHLSRSQLYNMEKHGEIQWLAVRYRGTREFIPADKPDAGLHVDGGILRVSRLFKFRGASNALGEFLSSCLRRREPWAEIMLHDMRGDREREDENPVVQELLQV
jgi:hypothetical protein